MKTLLPCKAEFIIFLVLSLLLKKNTQFTQNYKEY